MNDEIREAVKTTMAARKMTQTELAGKLGVTRQALGRALNERGKIPGLWKGILQELDLDLTVKPASKGKR